MRREKRRAQSYSHTARPGIRSKERYTIVDKGKSPETKGRRDNLKKGCLETSQAKTGHF